MKRIKTFLAILILIGLDQGSKVLAKIYLQGKAGIPLIKNIFEMQYLENRGAAFGILQNKQILLLIMTVIVLIILTICYFKMPLQKKYKPLNITYCMLCAGAIGNMIDRMIRGYVVDFFYFKVIDFPIFNVADIYVTCAICLLFLLVAFWYKEEDFDFLEKKGK